MIVQRFRWILIRGRRSTEKRIRESLVATNIVGYHLGDLSLVLLPEANPDGIIEMIYALDKIAPVQPMQIRCFNGVEVEVL